MNSQIIDSLPILIVFIAVVVVIFFICRELFCWYFKQTEQVELLKEIRNLLKNQTQGDYEETVEVQAVPVSVDEEPGLVPDKIFGMRTGAND